MEAMKRRALLLLFCCFLLAPLRASAARDHRPADDSTRSVLEYDLGAIVRTDRTKKEINLVFTGGDFADGGLIIREVLRKQGVKGSFFFTGDFYRKAEFAPVIRGLREDGHYLGAHSDKHLLYASWENRDSLLITRDEFVSDIWNNYAEMKQFGIERDSAPYFLPPYEWFNASISNWCREEGLTLVNFTPGTYSNADWTYPELGKQYLSSDAIYKRILDFEARQHDGLNGFLLLIHIGADPRRTDKLYLKLNELITELKKRGYTFTLLQETIGEASGR